MNESLTDIEVLVLRCRTEQSRSHISEAVLCYRSGAYRATIVSVWIAVIFDLVDKVRELALAGEGNATGIWNQYQTYIQQIEDGSEQGIKSALEFERTLLRTCKDKLQFFDQQQMVDLERLREDRHRCAHPSFQRVGEPYRPSAEQARLHLTNAMSHVLSQPPLQGKAQLARLRILVSSTYFPQAHEQAVIQLRASALGKASDSLINTFIDTLVFDYFDKASSLYSKPQVSFALNAITEMYRPQAEARLRKQFNRVLHDALDGEMGGAAALVTSVHSFWSLLEQPGRDKLQQYVRNTPNLLVLPGLQTLSRIPELDVVVREKIDSLSREELGIAINSFGLRAAAKRRALGLTSEVASFNSANDAINQCIFPLFDYFTKEEFVELISFPRTTGADLVGANAYAALIERLRHTPVFGDEELDQLLINNNAGWLVRQR